MFDSDSIIISLNPKAGRRSSKDRADALAAQLQTRGYHVRLLTDLTEVAAQSAELHREGRLRALVGVGGDGTAATLANLTAPGTPLTLLSGGTANLLAKHFRLGRSPQRLAEIIADGECLTLDAGRVRFGEGEEKQERLFLVMVSCGFDAAVVQGVHSCRESRYQTGHKKGAHISYLSYIKPLFKSLVGYRFSPMTIERFKEDDSGWEPIDTHARWAFVFNMNRYGWGLPLAPFAKENDGLLDHVLFRGGTVFHGGLYVALAQFSLHRFLPSAKLGQGGRYRISSDQHVPFQLDGDPGGMLPLEIEVIPKRLTLLVPKTTAKRFRV